ncbi:MAG: GHKL domain-containing protein [[Clostridium] innocuum]
MKENIQREITLKVGLTAPHIIVISIRNPYIGIIHQQEGSFLSTKHEGLGLKSVSLIAEKYDGYMQAEYDDQFFTVKVLLHV